jgi:hypothetical protein
MKSKLTFFTWLFAAAFVLNANATTRHYCPPENLSVATGEAPGTMLLHWNHPTDAECQLVNRFEVMVRTCINNQRTTINYIVDQTSMTLEMPAGMTCVWKVRSISFYQLSTERHSMWARGPAIGEEASKLDWDEEDVLDEAQIFPNPVYDNTMYIHINSSYRSGLHLNIVSLTGQVVYDEMLPLQRGSNYGDIDLSQLRSGVYFVRVSDGNKTRTVKIIKL